MRMVRLQKSYTNNKTTETEITTKVPQQLSPSEHKDDNHIMLQGLFLSTGWESPQDYYDKAKDEMQTWKDVLFPFDKSRRQYAKHWNNLPKAAREDPRAETKSSEGQTWILRSFKSSGFSLCALMHPLNTTILPVLNQMRTWTDFTVQGLYSWTGSSLLHPQNATGTGGEGPWEKDMAQHSWVWGCGEAPSWGCTNRETGPPTSKPQRAPQPHLSPAPHCCAHCLALFLSHPSNTWSPQNHIIYPLS